MPRKSDPSKYFDPYMRHEQTFFKRRRKINLIVILLTNNSSGSFTKDLEKVEAVVQRCSVKKVFLEISQNLQENTCARVSFFNKLANSATFLKKRLWHKCFPVNFAKSLRTLFLQNTSGQLLLAI